ncbi:MAG TPA: hypothetical protein VN081_05840 [Dongiaceae bacterium]|nr:hypothetical protein [Dongiaceae bacterium]
MSEYVQSYESNDAERDGDVVSPDDLEISGDMPDFTTHIDDEIKRRALLVAERAVDLEATRDYGEDYAKEVARIEAGIFASKEGGFGELKVQTDDGQWIELAHYIGGSGLSSKIGKTITLEGYNAIRLKYIGDPVQEAPRKKMEAPRYQSGAHTYRDFQSAAAGDYDEKDE